MFPARSCLNRHPTSSVVLPGLRSVIPVDHYLDRERGRGKCEYITHTPSLDARLGVSSQKIGSGRLHEEGVADVAAGVRVRLLVRGLDLCRALDDGANSASNWRLDYSRGGLHNVIAIPEGSDARRRGSEECDRKNRCCESSVPSPMVIAHEVAASLLEPPCTISDPMQLPHHSEVPGTARICGNPRSLTLSCAGS